MLNFVEHQASLGRVVVFDRKLKGTPVYAQAFVPRSFLMDYQQSCQVGCLTLQTRHYFYFQYKKAEAQEPATMTETVSGEARVTAGTCLPGPHSSTLPSSLHSALVMVSTSC